MVKKILKDFPVLALSILYATVINSQSTIKDQGEVVNGKSLYFVKETNDKISFFTKQSGIDDREEVNKKKTFALKNNYGNIYFKWLNPLRYKITWKDSISIDDRDKAIKDLVGMVAGRFGLSSTAQNKSESVSQLNSFRPNLTRAGGVVIAVPPAATTRDTIVIPQNGFNNSDLTDLYLQLRLKDNQGVLSIDEIKAINALTSQLESLDGDIITGIGNHVDEQLSVMIKIDNPADAKQTLEDEQGNVVTYKSTFKTIEGLQKDVTAFTKALSIKDALLRSLIKSRIQKFQDAVFSLLNSDKKIVANYETVLSQLSSSLQDEADMKGFFKIRSLRFDDGTQFETSITISEYEIKDDPKVLTKKGDAGTSNLLFKKYDFFDVSVSTGIFYANTTLRNYGVSPGTNNDFIVTEDEVNKSTAVTALFGNIFFATGSRYFTPLFQLGVDPTKKRPFLLLGGGFAIPAASFSISAGGVWTWQQNLDKLSVGKAVASSTDLDKDLKTNFNVEPKGWYLGIQYNF